MKRDQSWHEIHVFHDSSLVLRPCRQSYLTMKYLWWKRKYFWTFSQPLPFHSISLWTNWKVKVNIRNVNFFPSSFITQSCATRRKVDRQIEIESAERQLLTVEILPRRPTSTRGNLKNVREFVNQVIKYASMMTSLRFYCQLPDVSTTLLASIVTLILRNVTMATTKMDTNL